MLESKIDKVVIYSEAHAVCIYHALSSESAEIMGLLFGCVEEKKRTAFVHCAYVLHRKDIKPDRVEISPEMLVNAIHDVEAIVTKKKLPLKVVGWYHSHPHITALPSEIDLRSHGSYQMYMDGNFIGLIYSVYKGDAYTNQIEFACFQCQPETLDLKLREIPLEVSPLPPSVIQGNWQNFSKLATILFKEEADTYTEGKNPTDKMVAIFNGAFQAQNLMHILITVMVPVFQTIQNKVSNNRLRIEWLKNIKEELLKELKD